MDHSPKPHNLDLTLNFAPESIKSVYLMGMGGVAMGALAAALDRGGLTVRGSDNPLYPPMSTYLQERGLAVASGYDAANLFEGPRPDLVIVGNVIQAVNPEVSALAEMRIPYLSLPQAVGHFFIRERTSIVVAGTHGKTTTTALIASALSRAGLDPGFMVGGIMLEDGRNFVDGTGTHFVVEGDEYDAAFFDKRPKFVHYRPQIAILSSVEFDHADIYSDLDAVRDAFAMLMRRMPAGGCLVAWGDSPEVMAQASTARCKVISYGQVERCDWRLLDLQPADQGGMDLRLALPGGRQIKLYTPCVGAHNALNVMAACAAMAAGGMDPEQAAALQAKFGGVKRRQEVRGRAGGVLVVDDFAHHPTAVGETVKAVARFGLKGWRPGGGRLAAVFEPRTNTSRQSFFQADYAEAFYGADQVFLREPPGAEAFEPHNRLSCSKLADDLTRRDIPASAYPDSDLLLQALAGFLRPGDLCLIIEQWRFRRPAPAPVGLPQGNRTGPKLRQRGIILRRRFPTAMAGGFF